MPCCQHVVKNIGDDPRISRFFVL